MPADQRKCSSSHMTKTVDSKSANQGEEQTDRFKVYDFGLPDSARDTVTVELQRACKKESLDDLVRAYHDQHPDGALARHTCLPLTCLLHSLH